MSGIVGSKFNHRGSGLIGSLWTDGQHLLSSGAGKTNVFEPVAASGVTEEEGTAIRQDILTLGLKQAVQENSTKFNLPNSAICKFEADADFNLAGSTTIARNTNEYVSSITTATGSARFTNTLNGSAARSATQSKFGSYSLYCAADSDYLTTSSLQGITGMPTTGDFTVDYWHWNENRVYADRDFSFGPRDGSGAPTMSVGFNATSTMNVYMDEVNNDTASISHDSGAWHHFAFQRSGTTLYHYVDGVYKSSIAHASVQVNLTQDTTSQFLMISGRHGSTTEFAHGYYDEWRLSNVARYTNGADFTPMTEAYSVSNGGLDINTMMYMNFNDVACADTSGFTQTVNATGPALGNTNVPTSAVTDVSGVILLKNDEGTATLGTDLKVYYTCDNSAFTEASSYTDAGTFSSGIKMIKLGKSTCASGSDVRWKIVWANQADGSKETLIYGIGLNY